MVMAEFEEAADAILPTFGNLPQALLEIINGRRACEKICTLSEKNRDKE